MTSHAARTKSYAPVIIACCFGIQAIGIGIYISYGVFFNSLMTEFSWSRATISGASSLAFFISGLFGIFIGRLNDRVGPKRIMTVTAVFFGSGCMLMSQLGAVWQLYLFFGIIFGIGLSSVDVIALTTIARWFPYKRGLMTGITKVGTGAGQLCFTLMASFLISGTGWRNAYLVLGAGSLILLSIIARLIRRDPGAMTDEPSQRTGRDNTRDDLTFAQATRTVNFWILCLINLLVVYCLLSILVHIVPHGRDVGISPHKAAGVLSTIGGVSMAGRFVIGIIIDRIGSKSSMILSFAILITGLLWLQLADTLWELYLFAAIYGLAHGGIFTVISPIVAEFFGTASHGALFGMVVCFGTTGGAIGPIITGYLFDISHSYTAPFAVVLGVSLAGLILLLLVKPEITIQRQPIPGQSK